jgi:predicted transcriptional regulator
MSKAMSVRLPNYLHREIKKLAEQEGISMNQFIATAAAEKMSSLKTVDYLKERAERGSREKFERVLQNVPDVEPEEHDKL